MFSHAVSSPQRHLFSASSRTPFRYVRVPDQLLRAALHNPRVAAVYALIARTWLVRGEAVPLSSSDLVAFDPSLSRGAAQRAIAWLIDAGWVHSTRAPGAKSSLTPTWGRIRDAVRLWTTDDPRCGRPPHVQALALDLRLLDVYMGRLIPFAGQRSARVTRYLSQATLTLDDVGRYALLARGYGGAGSAALEQLGLVATDRALPLADEQTILARLSQLPLHDEAGPSLNQAGLRRAGLVAQDVKTSAAQPLFFVPHTLIGTMSVPVIGHLIDEHQNDPAQPMALESAGHASTQPAKVPEGIPWETSDNQENQPTTDEAKKGGGGAPFSHKRTRPEPLPDTPSGRRLQAFHVAPESIRAFASLPLDLIDECIAYAEAERGIQSKQGWVVWALHAYQSYGFRPAHTSGDQPVDWAALARDAQQEVDADSATSADAAERTCATALPAPLPTPPAAPDEYSLCPPMGDATAQLRAALHATLSPAARRGWATYTQAMRACRDERGVLVTFSPAAFRHVVGSELHLILRQVVRSWSPTSPLALQIVAAQRVVPEVTEPAAAPAWIPPQRWFALPALLRAALAGADLVQGDVRFRSPALAAFVTQRHAEDLAQLVRDAA